MGYCIAEKNPNNRVGGDRRVCRVGREATANARLPRPHLCQDQHSLNPVENVRHECNGMQPPILSRRASDLIGDAGGSDGPR
jgi:hypothetical protein